MANRPVPICKCFVICRQVFYDDIKQDYLLYSPIHQVFSQRYPLTEDLSVFARWSNAHGVYPVEMQLRRLDGEVLWRQVMERPFETTDPLQVCIVTLRHLGIRIPAPGKYEIALLADNTEVATDVLLAHLVQPDRA